MDNLERVAINVQQVRAFLQCWQRADGKTRRRMVARWAQLAPCAAQGSLLWIHCRGALVATLLPPSQLGGDVSSPLAGARLMARPSALLPPRPCLAPCLPPSPILPRRLSGKVRPPGPAEAVWPLASLTCGQHGR